MMNYTRDQLFALRPHGRNTICLAMRPRSGKHPKQIGSNASNLITVPITTYNGTVVQNVSIGLINCQSICNKSDEISDEISDVTPAGYSIHHAARIHNKGGEVGILLRDSLKCETHLRFQAFESSRFLQ